MIYPLNHARIGYASVATFENVIASSQVAGFPGASAARTNTFEYWLPSVLPAAWLTDPGEDVTVDYFGIAAHTLGDYEVEVTLQHSADGEAWTDAASKVVEGNGPVMVALDDPITDRYWRLYFEETMATPTMPQVGVIFIGEVLEMARPFYSGHTPINYGRVTEYIGNRSEGGQVLGVSIIRKGTATDFAWDNLQKSWVDEYFNPFIKAVRGSRPFFIAWNLLQYPDEVGYVFVGQDIRPKNSGVLDFMSVSFSAQGVSDE